MGRIKAVLTDIEGTTTSISFVHDVLFPYSAERIEAFVRSHAQEPGVASLLDDVRSEVGRSEMSLGEVIAQLEAWIAQDKKVMPLKAIQGLMWENGYRHGDFTGHVYEDAVRQLKAWHRAGIRLYVYSSGSVHAQKLLFGHSDAGDLTPLFDGHFDTRVGGKREADSYRAILEEIGLAGEAVLFLSDVVEELDAAADAGLQTCGLARDGELPEEGGHPWVADFDAVAQRCFSAATDAGRRTGVRA